MSSGNNEAVAGEALSALIDGEADASVLGRACAAWRDQPATRSEWHTYHLIGDVMRSDDLASAPGRDAAFLARLRVRLADEPVVLAPAPLAPATRRMRPRRWAGPVAVELCDPTVAVDGDLAVVFGLGHMQGRKKTEGDVELWYRVTLVFERLRGGWKVVHEHLSVPFRMDGSGRAALDLRPDGPTA